MSAVYQLSLLQAHLRSSVIFNGVCVSWLGSMDLETLTGKARLAFNEEMAKVSSRTGAIGTYSLISRIPCSPPYLRPI